MSKETDAKIVEELFQTMEAQAALQDAAQGAFVAPLLHATARALERLRWPVNARDIPYRAAIGESACGPLTQKVGNGRDWFRAEDAKALLQGKKTSSLQKSGHAPKTRYYEMPTCPKCCVLIDEALSNPYVIHASAEAFGDGFEEIEVPTAFCDGSKISLETPVFDFFHMENARSQPDIPWLPTCPICLNAVKEKLMGKGW